MLPLQRAREKKSGSYNIIILPFLVLKKKINNCCLVSLISEISDKHCIKQRIVHIQYLGFTILRLNICWVIKSGACYDIKPELKFIYSEKVTKFCEIFAFLLTTVHTVRSKVKISQNFVAFSEYMNFNSGLMS